MAMVARQGLRSLGVIENMYGLRCASCQAPVRLFTGAPLPDLIAESGIPLLARVPWADPLPKEAFEPLAAACVAWFCAHA
jgi:Mrp family chromosome partitioning ATPase